MRTKDSVEKLIADLKVRPSAELDARVRETIEKALAGRKSSGNSLPNLWSILMKTWKLSWAALAAILVGAVALIAVLHQAAPAALGIERVIQAYNNIHSLHVKDSSPGQAEPNEFWIQSDPQGKVTRARYYLPVTEDGIKLITWTPEKSEIWFKSKRGYVTFQTKRIAPWMQNLLDQSQPQLVLQKLLEARQAGKVDIQVQDSPGDPASAKMVVSFKTQPRKDVYYIDSKTELVARIESYRIEDGKEILRSTTEFSDYNAPFEDRLFSLRGELTPDVRISDRLNQIAGVPQGAMTDEQAAVETVRQFCQALLQKDYKKAGLIQCGELEEYARKEFGKLQVTAIVSVGPAIAQPDWCERGFKVPCELEIIGADGQRTTWKPAPYVRPGDDEMHPDYWNITGGISADETAIKILPENAKYEKMTPKEAAAAFFAACAQKNWEEFAKFWPLPDDPAGLERMKEGLGGLEVISLGEPFQNSRYPGWYVPYEIKLPPTQIYLRVSNRNPANRYVVTGVLNRKQGLQEEIKWSKDPEVLANNEAYAKLSPAEVARAYFDAIGRLDWEEMGKFAPPSDVDQTRRQLEQAQKAGVDPRQYIPAVEEGAAEWSAEQSAYLVKCRVPGQVKKWNLAVRNDNQAHRYVFDGGL